MKRREFLLAAVAAAVTPGKGATVPKAAAPAKPAPAAPPVPVIPPAHFKKRIKLAVSTYSYWHFEEKKFPVETVIERAAELGVEGIDILHRQMDLKETAPLDAAGRAYCRKLKRLAFRNGLAVVCLSTHQNFVSPNPKARQAAVNHTLKCIEIADALGAGSIRINAGRWNTITDFDEFMKKRGIEPSLAGHTEDEAFDWSIDCLGKCLARAEDLGIVLALFVGIIFLETFPDKRIALQETLGLREAVLQMEAEKPTLEEKPASDTDPVWQRTISAFSVAAIPFVLVFFIIFAALKRIPVYEEFVEGAKEGWAVAVRIMPFIVAMLAALAILRNSGALLLFQNLLRPVLEFVRFPAELLPMALMRPLSGSGSQGVLVEILTNEGISETLKYTAATMFGSTETTFYVLAVYFGSVAVRRTRHALAAGLCADLAGVIASVVICQAMFG